MNIFEKIMAVWGKVSIVQRALLMAIVLTMGIIVALLTYWARLPDMQLLFAELSPEDAAKVTDKISEKNAPYELRNGGRSVYVPRDSVYQLRLELAKDGLPGGEQGGYKLFDNEKIGISPFVQNVNLKRALQDELAKSIQMIEGVAQARIHIVSSDQTLFASGDRQTSASVVLKLRPGYKIGNSSIAAIANLVAGSVEGLKADNVTIVDGDGRLLSGQGGSSVAGTGGAGTVADYRQRVEQALSEKVQQMLETVLGQGRATVRVSAEVNMTSVSTVTESYSPTAKVATKEEIKSNSEVEPASVGEAGKAGQAGTKKDETVTTEYVVGKTVEQKVIVPGEVTALSVAAVVDLSPAEANQAEGEQTAKIMQIADVEKLIETALGLDLKGRDSLKVVEAKFFRPAVTADEAQQGRKLDYAMIAKQGSLGITAICALLVLKIFTKAKKKAAAEAPGQGGAAGIPAGIEAAGMLPGTTSAAEPVIVRRQLTEVMRNNPEQTRRLFVNWLQEKA